MSPTLWVLVTPYQRYSLPLCAVFVGEFSPVLYGDVATDHLPEVAQFCCDAVAKEPHCNRTFFREEVANRDP